MNGDSTNLLYRDAAEREVERLRQYEPLKGGTPSKPTSFYSKAARAFRRVHGYPHDPAKIEHQKFMCGWQHGYLAGKRKRSRPNG